MPGYAPDVNPIEQAWGSLKSKELANLCSDIIDEVADIAEDGLSYPRRRCTLLRVPAALRLATMTKLRRQFRSPI
jgi:transposase